MALERGKVQRIADVTVEGAPPSLTALQAEGMRSAMTAPPASTKLTERPVRYRPDPRCSLEHAETPRSRQPPCGFIQQARLREATEHHAADLEKRVAERRLSSAGESLSARQVNAS